MATVEAAIVTSGGAVVPDVVLNINSDHEGYFRAPRDTVFHTGEKLRLLPVAEASEICGIPASIRVVVRYVEESKLGDAASTVVRFSPRPNS
ncbi:MAG: hypothetical protein ABIK89_16085 [Planctomycetota bacterium]